MSIEAEAFVRLVHVDPPARVLRLVELQGLLHSLAGSASAAEQPLSSGGASSSLYSIKAKPLRFPSSTFRHRHSRPVCFTQASGYRKSSSSVGALHRTISPHSAKSSQSKSQAHADPLNRSFSTVSLERLQDKPESEFPSATSPNIGQMQKKDECAPPLIITVSSSFLSSLPFPLPSWTEKPCCRLHSQAPALPLPLPLSFPFPSGIQAI